MSTGWCFAIVNKKLAEIFFERRKNKLELNAHCFIKKSDYETKKEKQYIKTDTKKYKFTYRKGVYKDERTGKTYLQSKNWFQR